MSSGIIEIVKVAAMEAIANSKPCELKTGTVISVKPLRIRVSNDLTLPEAVLIVPQRLTDYTIEISGKSANVFSVEGNTLFIQDGDSADESTETITVHNSLKIGDNVILIRNQGGKSYYIADRI